ncbi:hypothetical protein [Actinosynnema mirum]|uniref:Uncharacterized protein n=1 Tax=Actinosynnema mirum (strain ATCC 29888 / DSM 43827 / JCM 3225 / NBRC 14064 / NCIMB 13271 / NRRL B-12336 / IMRU 3971 / 101) TaxID=446462 RepID=C6WFV1_ACTMD|nr:hypothetical protein [Actinosynnema mirum]ACU37887.1 hypothetical protein Amir_4024 [Actinosynnema mirum DSM 43827]
MEARGFGLVELPHHDPAHTRLGAVSGVDVLAVRDAAEAGRGVDGQVLKALGTPLSWQQHAWARAEHRREEFRRVARVARGV